MSCRSVSMRTPLREVCPAGPATEVVAPAANSHRSWRVSMRRPRAPVRGRDGSVPHANTRSVRVTAERGDTSRRMTVRYNPGTRIRCPARMVSRSPSRHASSPKDHTLVTTTDLFDSLAAHKTLGAAPAEELAWLASHGTLRQLATGDVLSSKSARVGGIFVVLTGRIAIFVDRGAGLHKMMEWRAGDVTGVLPYSRLGNPPGDTIAQEPSSVLAIPRDDLREMIRDCHEVTSILVHTMLDRARAFTSSDLHDEKLVSLGKLSAGLAHELNNPAAAIVRGASLLDDRLEDAERATRALGGARLTDEQLAAVDTVRAACLFKPVVGVRSPIERAEREDEIADWLAERGLDVAAAEALADTSVTIKALDHIAAAVHGPALNAVLRWTAAGCSVRSLASDIQEAAMRISGLVMAIKGFTHMDQATVAE